MESTDRPTSVRRLGVAAVLAGLVVVVLQMPWGGGVSPSEGAPTCFWMFHLWTVPCGVWPTLIAGAVTALLVWLVLLVKENRN